MCDTVCSVQTTRTFFAKNSDRPITERQLVEAVSPRPAAGELALHTQYLTIDDGGAAAVIGARPEWLWGFEHGLNEHRVAIGNEKVWTATDPATCPDALIGMDLVRLGLERAGDADDAVDVITTLLSRHGQGGIADAAAPESYFSSFLIADPTKVWVLETSGRSWVAREVTSGGAAISNRLSLRENWSRSSDDVPAETDWDRYRDQEAWVGLADVRLAVTRPAVEGFGDTNPFELARLLRNHGGQVGLPSPDIGEDGTGITVCMHVRGYQCTTSSIIAELPVDHDEPVRAWVAVGSPCTSVYLPTFGTSPLPASLAEPATYDRFAALRARVECDPWDQERSDEALGEIRAVLDPVEADLWHEANQIAARADRHLDWSAQAWPAVDDALTKLGV